MFQQIFFQIFYLVPHSTVSPVLFFIFSGTIAFQWDLLSDSYLVPKKKKKKSPSTSVACCFDSLNVWDNIVNHPREGVGEAAAWACGSGVISFSPVLGQ